MPNCRGLPRISERCSPVRQAACVLSYFRCVRLFVTPMDCSPPGPLSMGFSRQEYWSRLPCPPPGDLPNPGIQPASLASPVLAGGFFTTSATGTLAFWAFPYFSGSPPALSAPRLRFSISHALLYHEAPLIFLALYLVNPFQCL